MTAVLSSLGVVVVAFWALANYTLSPHTPTPNAYAFVTAFFLSVIFPRAAVLLLLTSLMLSPILVHQYIVLMSQNVLYWQWLGLDIAIGFSIGAGIRVIPRLKSLGRLRTLVIIGSVFGFVFVTATVTGFVNNLEQVGHPLRLKALWFSFVNSRTLDWFDDFHGLRPLQSAMVAVVSGLVSAAVIKKGGIKIRWALAACSVGATVGAGYALLQWIFGVGHILNGVDRGVHGFYPDIHSFAGSMALGLAVSIVLVKIATGRLKFIGGLGIGFCILGLAVSKSRFTIAALLPFSLLAILVLLGMTRCLRVVRRIAIACSSALVAAALIAVPLMYSNIENSEETASTDWPEINKQVSYRPEIWLAAARLFNETRGAGIGLGNFVRLSSLQPIAGSTFLARTRGENAHNYFVQILTEAGVVGFAAFTLFFFPLAGIPAKLTLILAALGLSNLYAHSFLIPDFLVLAGVFASLAHLYGSRNRYNFAYVLPVLAFVWAIAAYSNGHEFNRKAGRLLCQQDRGRTHDGWISGAFAGPFPARFVLKSYHPDIGNEPLQLTIIKIGTSPDSSVTEDLMLGPGEIEIDNRALAIQSIRVNRCYRPMSYGASGDGRWLAVNIREL